MIILYNVAFDKLIPNKIICEYKKAFAREPTKSPPEPVLFLFWSNDIATQNVLMAFYIPN